MPVIGFGTYRIPAGNQTYDSVKTALELGYRMIDTAEVYGNQKDVGKACRDSGIPRSDIFVTSKLWDSSHGYDQALQAGRKTVTELGLDYMDLYLIHSPGQMSKAGGKIVETWDALIQLQKEGLVRSVGVSNFGVQHLRALQEHGRPTPAVNQFELHPFVYTERADVVEYCKKNGILVQPYGSVLSGHREWLQKASDIAKLHNKTPAQILLRWALDMGFQVIPKSTHRDRMAENLNVFDFTLTQQDAQSMISTGGGRLPDYWNPLGLKVDTGDVKPKS
jgi:diketogulonate reductase-like aldo/keto reductase